jgi:hypothetical protein
MKTNYFAYVTVILTIAIVYIFGELKYEKKMAKTKELWLLEDASELEEKIEYKDEVIQALAKQNKEYEIILGIIKLKMAQNKESKEEEPQAKSHQQSTIPSFKKMSPGKFIPKGQKSPNDLNSPFAV